MVSRGAHSSGVTSNSVVCIIQCRSVRSARSAATADMLSRESSGIFSPGEQPRCFLIPYLAPSLSQSKPSERLHYTQYQCLQSCPPAHLLCVRKHSHRGRKSNAVAGSGMERLAVPHVRTSRQPPVLHAEVAADVATHGTPTSLRSVRSIGTPG